MSQKFFTENKKKILLGFFGVVFFALAFWLVQPAPKVEAGACIAQNTGTNPGGCNQHFSPPLGNGYCVGSQPVWDNSASSATGTCMVRNGDTPAWDPNTWIFDKNCNASVNSETCDTGKCPSSGFGLANGSDCQVYYNTNPAATSNATCKETNKMTFRSGKWDNTSKKRCVECSGAKGYVWGTATSIAYATPPLLFNQFCGADANCDGKNQGDNCGGTSTCDSGGKCVVTATCDTNPTVTINPSTQNGLVGTELNYTVNIRNNDDASCPTASRTFNLTSTKPSSGTWTDSFVSASLSATKGGGTNSTTYKLKSLSGTAEGNYTFKVKAQDAKGSAEPTGTYTVTTCSANTFIKFNNDKYLKGTIPKMSYAVASSEPTNNFARCEYNPSGSEVGSLSSIAHVSGNGNMDGNFGTKTGDVLGTWTTALVAGTTSCPGAPSGCIGSTKVVECLVGADCAVAAGQTCDPSTNTCVGPTTPPPPAGPISSSFCEKDLVPADAGKLCGTHTVTNAEVSAKGWCCSAANFVAADKPTCQAVDSACAGTTPPPPSGPVCGNNTDGVCPTGCTNPPDTDCPVIPSTPAGPCASGTTNYRSPLSYCSIQDLIKGATGWVLGLVSSIVILFLVYGGIMYTMAAGDETKMESAKNIIYYAILGLAIILISYTLITEVKTILKVK